MYRELTVTITLAACVLANDQARTFGQTSAHAKPELLTSVVPPEPKTVQLNASRQRPPDQWTVKARVVFLPDGPKRSATKIEYVPQFSVTDNGSDGVRDLDADIGKIQAEIPRPFQDFGIYLIAVSGSRVSPCVVYVEEGAGNSWFDRFSDWCRRIRDRLLTSTNVSLQWTLADPRQYAQPPKDDLWLATVPGPEDGEPERLSSLPRVQTPAWSPDGERLVCSVWRGERWRLAVFPVVGNKINPDPDWQWDDVAPGAADASPVFSPDGSTIAFLRVDDEKKSDAWVLILGDDGRPTDERRLTRDENVRRVVAWTEPTGLLIETSVSLATEVVEDDRLAAVLAELDPDAGTDQSPVIVACPVPGGVLASFSSNAEFAVTEAFRLGLRGGRRLIMVSADRDPRPLDTMGSWPRISPDGERMFFTGPSQ